MGRKKILENINFEAKSGELIGILGANGAGKTTLLRAIAGRHALSGGSIFWKSENIAHFGVKKIALERAVLSQQIRLAHDFSVAEVVMMGRYAHFKSSPKPEDRTAVADAMAHTDVTMLAQRSYRTLSGGEKQRVQLSRILAQLNALRYPGKLLLLDEPFNNLDMKYRYKIAALTQKIARTGNTVLAAMHDLNMAAQYSDKILFLKKGKMEGFDLVNKIFTEEKIRNTYNISNSIRPHPFADCPFVYFVP